MQKSDYLAYFELGNAHERVGALAEALKAYYAAVEKNPKFAKAINAMAGVLYKQQQYEKALQMFHIALDVDANYYELYSNIGATLSKLKRYDEAEKSLLKAIKLLPKNAGAYTNLGNLYNKRHLYQKAIEMHQRAIALDSTSALAFANLAIAQKNSAQMINAIKNFKEAIKRDKKFVNAHFDLSTALLSIGEFEQGFREYEWRFYKEEMRGFIKTHRDIFSKPILSKNTNAYKKRVLIHSEQGFGDSIMMARFIVKIKETFGCEVIFKARDELVELFRNTLEIDEICPRSAATPAFDYHLPIMSAAFVLDVKTREDFETTPYIEPKNKSKNEKQGSKKKIGICWSASSTGESYEGKVFDLSLLAPLLESQKYEIYSLQVGDASSDIKKLGFEALIIDKSKELVDFSKTADFIATLDCVISSDTSVAHLCGAMGVECYTMLQKVPDWRWGLEGEESFLYTNMKLLRQKERGDWEAPFSELFSRLGIIS